MLQDRQPRKEARMPVPIFDFITTLETDIAGFYRRLKAVSRLVHSGPLFDFMATHSEGHAREVAGLAARHVRPELDQAFLREVHGHIKHSLEAEIRNAPDLGEVIEKLAKTEELVGKMYLMIGAHYRSLAAHATAMADDMQRIADEEFQHRDMVRRDRPLYDGTPPG